MFEGYRMYPVKWSRVGEEIYANVSAQQIADEIMSIGESASPKQIVDKARDEGTELHKVFEWDDAIAAEKYRCDQARHVVRCLVIDQPEANEDKPEIRVWHKVDNQEGYRRVELIVRHEDEYAALLSQANRELKAFRVKYSTLNELREIFDMIDKIA